jgi:hypothetical protein
MLGRELAPIVDGYSIHSYWDYWDIRKFRRHLDDTVALLNKLPKDQRRPLYVTEFGARGFREHPSIEPGQSDTSKPLCDVPVYSFEIAIYLLDALNRGFIATAQWDLYDAWYDRKMGYGLIGDVTRNFPLKPGYHLLQMFTRHTRPGMRAIKIGGAIEDFWFTALRHPDSRDETLILLNRIKSPKSVMIAGLAANRTFTIHHWNFNGTGELSDAGTVTSDARGVVTRTVPHMAVELLTTVQAAQRDRN